MALVKSITLSAISGSIAGATFARNSSGMYMRARSVPVNPNTTNQILARGGMTNAARAWRDLTSLNQAAWKTYAQNTPTVNRIGDVIHLSGIAQFVKLNGFRAFLGLVINETAPEFYGSAPAITSSAFEIDDASNLNFTNVLGGSVNAGAHYGIWISNAISTGVTFYKGPWNYLGTTTGALVGTSTWTIPFTINVDQLFLLRIRYHDQNMRMSNQWISHFTPAVSA